MYVGKGALVGGCSVGGDVGGGEVVGTLLVAFVGGGFGPR